MISVKNVIKGWARAFGFMKTPESDDQLSRRRLQICSQCKYAKTKKILEILNGTANQVDAMVCTKCHCPCLEKSLVREEHCPVNRW